MASSKNLMAFSMNPQLARVLGRGPVALRSAGASIGDATVINRDSECAYTVASNGGSGFVYTTVGNANGPLPGDIISFSNIQAASVTLYLRNAAVVYMNGVSIAGATGITVTSGYTIMLQPMNASIWVGLRTP